MITATMMVLALAFPAAPSPACIVIAAGDGDTPIVEATINGAGPFAFVLDTAASGSTLDQPHVDQLGLPRDAATEQAQGMGGPLDVHLYRAARLNLGPLSLSDTTIPAIPAPAFDSHEVVGLVGVDIFGSALAVWRSGEGCVSVEASGARPAGDGWREVESNWLQPWKIMLPMTIDGVVGWGLLDTGAQYTTVNPVFAGRLGLTAASGRATEAGSIYGLDGRPLAVLRAEVSDAVVGEWAMSGRALRIGALPVFGRLGPQEEPLAIIGMDWLKDRDFAIDYGTRQVWQRTR